MQKCLLLSFTFSKINDGYSPIPYSISSILAKFKNSLFIDVEPEIYYMDSYFEYLPPDIETRVINEFIKKYINKINDYSFVAISAYAWSENIVKELIKILKQVFNGKIILGGYEITALNEEQLYKTYPYADFYVKGYAEVSLEKIFKNETKNTILNEKITDNDLVSVYLSETLPLTSKNIYWESKRGCPYHCDFCEYGNAGDRKVIKINDTRIDKEIKLFKQNNIKKINVLDSNFILDERDIVTLEKLIEIEDCVFNFQMNFDVLKNKLKDKLLSICKKNRDRIILEFGLQTIHENEMKVLRRENNIEHIKSVMKELNHLNIQYIISIIFGIPGQTYESFLNTIRFLDENGCKKYFAYPLRLPQNSKIKENMVKLKIKEEYHQFDAYPIKIVTESYSFTRIDWEMMYSIADKKTIPQEFVPIMLEIQEKHIASSIDNNSLFDKIDKKGLSDFIYERLCKNDISNTILRGYGADKFYIAINNILSIKPMRQLCIKDKNFALQITQQILSFIINTQQYIHKIDNPFKNEPQQLSSELLSQKKWEWEKGIIDKKCKILCEEIYKQIEQQKNM
jgi:radical SAM superfamily enzyme YgiQ (UPF0313 family)